MKWLARLQLPWRRGVQENRLYANEATNNGSARPKVPLGCVQGSVCKSKTHQFSSEICGAWVQKVIKEVPDVVWPRRIEHPPTVWRKGARTRHLKRNECEFDTRRVREPRSLLYHARRISVRSRDIRAGGCLVPPVRLKHRPMPLVYLRRGMSTKW
jgi:hypothetical protein